MTTLTITGNLVADPELRFTPGGAAVATFSVVSSKSVKLEDGTWENKDVTFWNVKAWNKLAENIADSLRKGVSVIVQGTAVQESWEDKTTGEKRSKIVVTAWNVGADLKRYSYTVPVVERSDSAGYQAPANDPWAAPLTDAPPF